MHPWNQGLGSALKVCELFDEMISIITWDTADQRQYAAMVGAVWCGSVQCCTMWYGMFQYSAVWCAAQCSVVLYNAVLYTFKNSSALMLLTIMWMDRGMDMLCCCWATMCCAVLFCAVLLCALGTPQRSQEQIADFYVSQSTCLSVCLPAYRSVCVSICLSSAKILFSQGRTGH